MNNTTDSFERIAEDAVTVLIAVALTLKLIGGEFAELGEEISDDTTAFCVRALALVEAA